MRTVRIIQGIDIELELGDEVTEQSAHELAKRLRDFLESTVTVKDWEGNTVKSMVWHPVIVKKCL
jgi:hypothetical protein